MTLCLSRFYFERWIFKLTLDLHQVIFQSSMRYLSANVTRFITIWRLIINCSWTRVTHSSFTEHEFGGENFQLWIWLEILVAFLNFYLVKLQQLKQIAFAPWFQNYCSIPHCQPVLSKKSWIERDHFVCFFIDFRFLYNGIHSVQVLLRIDFGFVNAWLLFRLAGKLKHLCVDAFVEHIIVAGFSWFVSSIFWHHIIWVDTEFIDKLHLLHQVLWQVFLQLIVVALNRR